ncbi:TMV resistance protein N-like [Glycine soja]|uniref:TMV resistance protein N-like n=1 Tax=Glycine soja TaxID=3848 RepID=UPI00103B9026|nr:TMV resistance protein N-like [Glycine soja]
MALRSFSYDVFLSFRGEDTRYGFTGNLYNVLRERGIHTFIDDEELQKGDEITTALEEAIEKSKIFIIVLSENYAYSSFCLNELTHILNFTEGKNDPLVLPVFYKVNPSYVRHHRGSFGEALANHEKKLNSNNMEKLETWKMALRQVSNISGHHLQHDGNKYEYKFIKEIVESVSSKFNRDHLDVPNVLVGLESPVRQVKSLLDVGRDDVVHMVGIHGLAGVGKTTLAVAVYNSIADHFEASCFLENVRETTNKKGLEDLQSAFLSKTAGEIKLTNWREGITIIKCKLKQKKVLLILDDVDEHKQLQAIIGSPDWFGRGSRVIITTRDEHLLALHNVKITYKVRELNEKHALQLLTHKAFELEKEVDPSYHDILNRAITYASGLPLALEVIGSNLLEKSIEEWESALDGYERIPDKKIYDILKVSYDALNEDEKNIFLDIACCFKAYKLEELQDILYAHYGHCMKYHIGVLVKKSLINIHGSWDYKVMRLHDLIEDMGKEIVRRESPTNPGKRSRLWSHEDINQVLQENKGTSKIEIICMNFSSFGEEVEWDGDAFKKMKNLKTLIIKSDCFSEGPKHLPNTLRVLEWWRCPSQDWPHNFNPKQLAICKLPDSSFTSVGLAPLFEKRLVNLTSLILDECDSLTEIPDVSCLSNLENLSFRKCRNLFTIHHSVGLLEKLKILDAECCPELKSFPPLKLTSLERFELWYCVSLESFPEILGKMENITQLCLYECPITKLPPSFRNLTRLRSLSLGHHHQTEQLMDFDAATLISNICMMPELDGISAHNLQWRLLPEDVLKLTSVVCSSVQSLTLKLSDELLPLFLSCFVNVIDLELSGSEFTVIPECIKECRFLSTLTLDRCDRLQEIRGIPPNLKTFSAMDSPALTSSSISMLLNQELHEAGDTDFSLPRVQIPQWFEHKNPGRPIRFWFRNDFPAIVACIAKSDFQGVFDYPDLSVFINGREHKHYGRTPVLEKPCTVLFHLLIEDDLDVSLLENEWNRAEIVCYGSWDECGIHVLKELSSMEDIRFTDPFRKEKFVVQRLRFGKKQRLARVKLLRHNL